MNQNLSRVSDNIQRFEQETLRLFHELVNLGHYERALEVLRSGQKTIALCKRVVALQAFTPSLAQGEKDMYENK